MLSFLVETGTILLKVKVNFLWIPFLNFYLLYFLKHIVLLLPFSETFVSKIRYHLRSLILVALPGMELLFNRGKFGYICIFYFEFHITLVLFFFLFAIHFLYSVVFLFSLLFMAVNSILCTTLHMHNYEFYHT